MRGERGSGLLPLKKRRWLSLLSANCQRGVICAHRGKEEYFLRDWRKTSRESGVFRCGIRRNLLPIREKEHFRCDQMLNMKKGPEDTGESVAVVRRPSKGASSRWQRLFFE